MLIWHLRGLQIAYVSFWMPDGHLCRNEVVVGLQSRFRARSNDERCVRGRKKGSGGQTEWGKKRKEGSNSMQGHETFSRAVGMQAISGSTDYVSQSWETTGAGIEAGVGYKPTVLPCGPRHVRSVTSLALLRRPSSLLLFVGLPYFRHHICFPALPLPFLASVILVRLPSVNRKSNGCSRTYAWVAIDTV